MRMKYVVIGTAFFCLLVLLTSRVLASGGFTSISQLNSLSEERITLESPSPTSSEQKNKVISSGSESDPTRNLSDFLTDVLAYQTAILALLIPLSFDVVSRISDRYRSEVIIKRFQKEVPFLGLIAVLVANITYILTLRFLSVESFWANSVVLFLTAASIGFMGWFFWLIFKYTSGTSFIKEKLINDARQLLK